MHHRRSHLDTPRVSAFARLGSLKRPARLAWLASGERPSRSPRAREPRPRTRPARIEHVASLGRRLHTAGGVCLASLARLGRDVLEFALPQLCPGCGARASAETLLCPACLAAIPRISFELCARCLVRGREPVGCLAHPGFAVRAAWVYDERAALVVHALKYDGRVRLAGSLGAELARAAAPATGVDLVTEVPLHATRRRERGYNQSALLAESLADRIGVPRLADVLERARPTAAQARLSVERRRRNVAGAFRARRPEWLEGRRVVIVDDVVTTGATLEACLAALAAAGARASAVTLAWAQ